MTQTLTKPENVSAFENEEFFEDVIPCSLLFRNATTGKVEACENVAKYDAIVTCALEHERTQHYCERCFKGACQGKVDCRVCKIDHSAPPNTCPITVVTSWLRIYR